MKKYTVANFIGIAALLLTITRCSTNKTEQQPESLISNNDNMPVYVIERELPGAGKLSKQDLKDISMKSCAVLDKMKGIKWLHSYVTENKIYCVYSATDTSLITEHGKNGGFPVDRISSVGNVISPVTATSPIK